MSGPATLAPPLHSARRGRRSRITPPDYVTAEDYLRSEEASEDKHEWSDGKVYAMPGVTIEHALLSPRIEELIDAALVGTPLRRLGADLKVRVPDGPYRYADVLIGRPPFDLEPPPRPDLKRTVLRNPAAIVEVLSDGTERTDRGEKLDGYRTIPSLRDVLLFSQDGPEVEHHFRDEGGAWDEVTHSGRGATFALAAGGAELNLGAIYSALDDLIG